MTTAELLQQRDICVYAVIYIKHLRREIQHRSFYSFLKRVYTPTKQECKEAHLYDIYLREHGYVLRISRQRYSWNTQGKTILINEIIKFF